MHPFSATLPAPHPFGLPLPVAKGAIAFRAPTNPAEEPENRVVRIPEGRRCSLWTFGLVLPVPAESNDVPREPDEGSTPATASHRTRAPLGRGVGR